MGRDPAALRVAVSDRVTVTGDLVEGGGRLRQATMGS